MDLVAHTHTIVTSTSSNDPPFPPITDPETTVPYTLFKSMSEIKLKKESMESKLPGITPDIDENNVPFNRLTFTVKHPISKEVTYYELNKNDSKSLLTEKKDGVYGNQEDVDYLKDNWCVSEYVSSLSLAWRLKKMLILMNGGKK